MKLMVMLRVEVRGEDKGEVKGCKLESSEIVGTI